MKDKKRGDSDKPDFATQIPEYDDEKILEILRKRNHYQPEAARLAIEEAIKRELIYSEHDLLAKEYRVKPLKKSFFPKIEDKTQKLRISRSIARGLLFAGVIPFIFGVLKLNEGNLLEGGLVVLGSVLWIVIAARTLWKVNLKIFPLFYVLLVIAAIYITGIFLQSESVIFMDFFVVVLVYGLAIYGILYLKKLHS